MTPTSTPQLRDLHVPSPLDPLVHSAGLRESLLHWYGQHRRELPWRSAAGHGPDPYHVWTSEVMLQQTRVETARGYFERWVTRFPTIEKLAEASSDDVMKAWEGLGYYSRARNFHAAAREVAARYGGTVPDRPEEFRALSGVGRYTAGAVMSIAFDQEQPVVDGNVRRVFARLWDEPNPAERDLWARAEALVRGERPGDLNQSLMELGATLCTPRAPRCGACPITTYCWAVAAGTQAERPTRKTTRPLPHEDTAVAVVHDDLGRVLLVRNPADGRLGSMWEFPSTVRLEGEPVTAAALRALRDRLGIEASAGEPIGEVPHAFSHVRVTYRALRCRMLRVGDRLDGYTEARWVLPTELQRYAMPAAQKKLAKLLGA